MKIENIEMIPELIRVCLNPLDIWREVFAGIIIRADTSIIPTIRIASTMVIAVKIERID